MTKQYTPEEIAIIAKGGEPAFKLLDEGHKTHKAAAHNAYEAITHPANTSTPNKLSHITPISTEAPQGISFRVDDNETLNAVREFGAKKKTGVEKVALDEGVKGKVGAVVNQLHSHADTAQAYSKSHHEFNDVFDTQVAAASVDPKVAKQAQAIADQYTQGKVTQAGTVASAATQTAKEIAGHADYKYQVNAQVPAVGGAGAAQKTFMTVSEFEGKNIVGRTTTAIKANLEQASTVGKGLRLLGGAVGLGMIAHAGAGIFSGKKVDEKTGNEVDREASDLVYDVAKGAAGAALVIGSLVYGGKAKATTLAI